MRGEKETFSECTRRVLNTFWFLDWVFPMTLSEVARFVESKIEIFSEITCSILKAGKLIQESISSRNGFTK